MCQERESLATVLTPAWQTFFPHQPQTSSKIPLIGEGGPPVLPPVEGGCRQGRTLGAPQHSQAALVNNPDLATQVLAQDQS